MARDFAGSSSDFLACTNGTANVTAVPLTLACWFNSDSTTVDQLLVCVAEASTGDSSDQFGLFASGASGGDPILANSRASGTSRNAATSSGYSAGTWNHACAVFASSTSRTAYLNGGSAGSNTQSSTPSTLSRYLAGIRNDLFFPFDGRMAEIGIWNAALTAAEVTALARGFSPLLVRPGSLVDYWPLSDESAVTDLVNLRNGDQFTVLGTVTVADHPRIIYPRQRLIVPAATSAAPNPKPPLLDSGSQLFAPTATPVIAVTAPLLASTSTLYAPSTRLTVTAPLLASTSALYEPSVAPVLNPTAPLLASTSVLYAPSTTVVLNPVAPLLASTSALYAPTVTETRTVEAPLLASTSALYEPSVAVDVALTAPLLASGSSLFAPTVSFTLTAPLLGSTSALHAPSVAPELALTAPLLTSVSELYAPTVSVTLSITAPLLGSASQLFDHAVVLPDTVVPPLLGSTSVIYDPSVSVVFSIGPPLLASGSVLYDPTVSVATVAVDTGAMLPTGGKPKKLPYGWWRDDDEAEEDLKAARAAIAEARKQIAAGAKIAPAVIARIDAAAYWAAFDESALKVERAMNAAAKKKARGVLNEIAKQITEQENALAAYRAELERERDDEEALFLLLH